MSPRPPLDSARLAWWLTAWLRGSARPDDVHDAVLDGDAAHHVIGLPGEPDPVPLLLALPALRRTRTRSAGLALPAPGHPCGLGGPAAFNKAALASGEAVVLDGAGLGLLPHRAGAGVMWSLQPAARRPLVDLHEASRALRRVLSEAATRLADLDVAVEHIRQFSSGHTDAIITEDQGAARRFVAEVDSAAVLVNASTRFTDGGEFGFGAEIGISTQKLHARGPMGLPEMTSTKYIVTGDGHVR